MKSKFWNILIVCIFLTTPCWADVNKTVAQDGSGDYSTIQLLVI